MMIFSLRSIRLWRRNFRLVVHSDFISYSENKNLNNDENLLVIIFMSFDAFKGLGPATTDSLS